jgi:putative ABC transport system permease protein
VAPRDPLVFAVVVFALAAAGFLASFLPARRVTKIDPLLALSVE